MVKNSKTVQQVVRFILVGGCSVVIDLATYSISIQILSTPVSKSIGFFAGTLFSYTFNKLWTFGAKKQSRSEVIRFTILYAVSMGINVGLNHIALACTNHHLLISFLFATSITTVINFIGQRTWVFKNSLIEGTRN